MVDLNKLYKVWCGTANAERHWPEHGLAIEGDFGGIQRFVYRPVPGARGAAKRLRARSFQVSALSDLVARKIGSAFEESVLWYQAGGRFLLHSPQEDGWEKKLENLRGEIDAYCLSEFDGEVLIYVAGCVFSDGKVPREGLGQAMARERERPLQGALIGQGGWNEFEQWKGTSALAFRCPACLRSANAGLEEPEVEGQKICLVCARDRAIGGQLSLRQRPVLKRVSAATESSLQFLGEHYELAEGSESEYSNRVVHHMPRSERHQPMTLEEIAGAGDKGKDWLGYLKLDADQVGSKFRSFNGDAGRILALSEFLQAFFCDVVQGLLEKDKEKQFQRIYPVYGGGDDLFVIGRWDEVIQFGWKLSEKFARETESKMSFSAGLALGKPKQHILTKAEDAEHALKEAKKESRKLDQGVIHALGASIPWTKLLRLLQQAKTIARFRADKQIPSRLLHQILGLYEQWQAEEERRKKAEQTIHKIQEISSPWDVEKGSKRHLPLLHYQVERNMKTASQRDAKDFLRALIHEEWPNMGFLMRYALLAGEIEDGEIEYRERGAR